MYKINICISNKLPKTLNCPNKCVKLFKKKIITYLMGRLKELSNNKEPEK